MVQARDRAEARHLYALRDRQADRLVACGLLAYPRGLAPASPSALECLARPGQSWKRGAMSNLASHETFTDGVRQVRISYFSRYALCICAAAALLAGCGGAQPPTAQSDAVGLAQRSRSAQHNGRGSWMLPEAKTEDLMYVSDGTLSAVLVFAYKSRKQVGQLTAFNEPYGQCVDAKGDVWITDVSNGTVAEYAHGGTKPLKTLTANQGGGPV